MEKKLTSQINPIAVRVRRLGKVMQREVRKEVGGWPIARKKEVGKRSLASQEDNTRKSLAFRDDKNCFSRNVKSGD